MATTSSTVGASAEFEAFFVASAPLVRHQLLPLTGDPDEAEDVTQEAFERAWLRWPAVRACDSPEAWVRTVAHRLAISRWRRSTNASSAWLRQGAPAALDVDESGHVALVEALRRLPTKQRVAVVLFHLADLSVEQVSEATGDSVSAVKQQLSRGRSALASLLAEQPDPPAPGSDGRPVAARPAAATSRVETPVGVRRPPGTAPT